MSAGSPQLASPSVPRVLVVEDSPALLDMFMQLLGHAGCEVVAGVRTGEEAVQRAHMLQPDLILMDVRLAGAMDGIEAAQEIQMHYDIPIIYLTAYADDTTLARAVTTGPYGYLVKPVDLADVRRAIEVVWVKYTMQHQLALSEARYRRMFEAAAVALLEEDIGDLLVRLEELRTEGVTDLRAHLAAHPDLVSELTGMVRIVDANEAALRLFGAASKEDLLGPLTPRVPPQALHQFGEEILAVAEQRDNIEYEAEAVTFDGETKQVLIRVTLPRDAVGDHIQLASITDITARVRAEESLRELHVQVQQHAEFLEHRVADRTRELLTLYAISEVASTALDLETMLDRALGRALEAVPDTAGFVHILQDSRAFGEPRHMRLAAARSAAAGGDLTVAPSLDRAILDWIVANDAPLLLSDTASTPHVQASVRQVSNHYVGMPMRAGGQMVGVLSALRDVGQAAFSAEEVALLTSVADQLGAGVESARLRRQAEQAAVLEERQRLARELHDSVTQSLYSLTLLTEGARRLALTGEIEDFDATFTDLRDISLQCLREMRLLVYELHASGAPDQGVVTAIQQRLDAVERRSGVDAQLVVDGSLRFSPPVADALAGIAREALNNALKHAGASSVVVRIAHAAQGGVELSVTDDGLGFDAAGDLQGGMGLTTMRERAEYVGGVLTIHSSLEEGTTVVARFPPGKG